MSVKTIARLAVFKAAGTLSRSARRSEPRLLFEAVHRAGGVDHVADVAARRRNVSRLTRHVLIHHGRLFAAKSEADRPKRNVRIVRRKRRLAGLDFRLRR